MKRGKALGLETDEETETEGEIERDRAKQTERKTEIHQRKEFGVEMSAGDQGSSWIVKREERRSDRGSEAIEGGTSWTALGE